MSQFTYSALFDTITPDLLAAFLKRKGWRQVKYANANITVFEGMAPSSNGDISVAFPTMKSFADFPLKLRDCVKILAEGFDKPIEAILHGIAHWDRDIFRIRVESHPGKEQLLPLDAAAGVISRYRDFVAFAAATEADPRRFFAKITGIGREFTDKCMFGHTFVGSFGITIECPLDLAPELPMPDAPPPRPFPRAVTERIASGYSNLSNAVRTEDPSVIVNNHRSGFSGNMCEILTNIYEALDGRALSNGMIWSPELPAPRHLLQEDEEIRIDKISYEILKSAAASLQTVDKPDEDKTIVGRVTRLKSEKPPLNTDEFAIADRTIVVRWEIEKRQPLYVHIELPLEQYRVACDAHKNGRKIKISGKPKKVKKFWKLTEHHDFELL